MIILSDTRIPISDLDKNSSCTQSIDRIGMINTVNHIFPMKLLPPEQKKSPVKANIQELSVVSKNRAIY